MYEEPVIIRMNISHYGATRKLSPVDQSGETIERLLVEAEQTLAMTTGSESQDRGGIIV
jgi:hypothetical protein